MDGTVGYTSDQITRLWTSRYADTLGAAYRVEYQGVALSPSPKSGETWASIHVFTGGASSAGVAAQGGVPYKLGTTAQTRSPGVVRIALNYPGNDPRTPGQFCDILDTCFGMSRWSPTNVWRQPAFIRDQKFDGNTTRVEVEIQFVYLKLTGLPESQDLSPVLARGLIGKAPVYTH